MVTISRRLRARMRRRTEATRGKSIQRARTTCGSNHLTHRRGKSGGRSSSPWFPMTLWSYFEPNSTQVSWQAVSACPFRSWFYAMSFLAWGTRVPACARACSHRVGFRVTRKARAAPPAATPAAALIQGLAALNSGLAAFTRGLSCLLAVTAPSARAPCARSQRLLGLRAYTKVAKPAAVPTAPASQSHEVADPFCMTFWVPFCVSVFIFFGLLEVFERVRDGRGGAAFVESTAPCFPSCAGIVGRLPRRVRFRGTCLYDAVTADFVCSPYCASGLLFVISHASSRRGEHAAGRKFPGVVL